MNRVPVIIEAVCFILNNLKLADKIHLVKLMYLADKYHAMNYGRTISGDDFLALPHGPAGSRTMDVLEYDSYVLGEYLDYAKKMFTKGKGYQYEAGKKCTVDSLEMLSESDIEALEFSIENFGKMDQWAVVDYTHGLPEWKPFKRKFEEKKIKQESIKPEDVLRNPADKYFSISQEHINKSLKILRGTFD
jgi:uncharacterized phage-associated protein